MNLFAWIDSCGTGATPASGTMCRIDFFQQDLDRQIDVRLPGKGNSNSHGAGPVHQIISMIKWIRTSRLSIKNYLSLDRQHRGAAPVPVQYLRWGCGQVCGRLRRTQINYVDFSHPWNRGCALSLSSPIT